MNYALIWAFRLTPSGFPLYLCSLPRTRPKSRTLLPFPIPRSPFPVPAWLAKDAAPIPNAFESTSQRVNESTS